MIDLDFAFFNLRNQDKRGLFYRKFFLDRLAPIFFAPRVEKLIHLSDLDAKGCSISLPLGPGNLKLLDTENQEDIVQKSTAILDDFNLPAMAVDRCHKQQVLPLFSSLPLIFGDNFIKALALVFIREILSRHHIKKVVIVGETEFFADFVAEVGRLGVPVSLQSYCPSRYEILAYRLLYEKGQAVSTSYMKAGSWEKGDLVLMFEPDMMELAISSPQAFCLKLSNDAQGLALDLENYLRNNGIDAALHSLAPIMEISLLSKAGFLGFDAEKNIAREAAGRQFLELQKFGYELGLWDLFLDKVI